MNECTPSHELSEPTFEQPPSDESDAGTLSSRTTSAEFVQKTFPINSDDLKVAEYFAKHRGIPPALQPCSVQSFLSQYGYDAVDDMCWGRHPTQQPDLSIVLIGHIEFGEHTQYELMCRVAPSHDSSGPDVSWRTIRRLKHIRVGLHAPIKCALGSRYGHYFKDTPFANRTAPNGTTTRLRAWFCSLAGCINSGGLEPSIVAETFRLLDGPGTPLHAQGHFSFRTATECHKMPLTAAMFGSKDVLVQADLPRVALGTRADSANRMSKEPLSPLETSPISEDNILQVGFRDKDEERNVQIFRKPLGAEFCQPRKNGPLKIDKVRPLSYAAELGLEVGWIVENINGEDVRHMSYQQLQDAMRAGLMRLPLVVHGRGLPNIA
jgi:hypothetical protein